jgi:hypothetical protein
MLKSYESGRSLFPSEATATDLESDAAATLELGICGRLLLDYDPLVPPEAENLFDIGDVESEGIEQRLRLRLLESEEERHGDHRRTGAHDNSDFSRKRYNAVWRWEHVDDASSRLLGLCCVIADDEATRLEHHPRTLAIEATHVRHRAHLWPHADRDSY